MTLPASFPLAMSQIATELGLSLPLSISHPLVMALGGKTSLPVSFSDLLGQSASWNFNGTPIVLGPATNVGISGLSQAFMHGVISSMNSFNNGVNPGNTSITFSSAVPAYSGNIRLTNNTTSVSVVLTRVNGTLWRINSYTDNLFRQGVNDNFTVVISS
ncbi:hypothetical protein [Burkholderia multivorans]|uniref:hypothetical protein n=1 Tax=Burkholderia multivorans TaxID=87883 RepID=UPI00111C9AC3|nr:hypothetical protein [Burkholderia multivorans]